MLKTVVVFIVFVLLICSFSERKGGDPVSKEVRVSGPIARDEGLRKREELALRVEGLALTAAGGGNPNHSKKDGRFVSGKGGGSGGLTKVVKKGKVAIAKSKTGKGEGVAPPGPAGNRRGERGQGSVRGTQRKARAAEKALAAARVAEAAAVEAARVATTAPPAACTHEHDGFRPHPCSTRHDFPKPKPVPKPAPTATPPASLFSTAESLIGTPASGINSDGQYWCADFISFLTGNPLGGDPGPVDVKHAFPPTTTPVPGDAVLINLFYGTSVGHDPTHPTHVAVVSRITDTHVEVIEGNGASTTHIAVGAYPLGAVTSYAELPRSR